MKPKMMSIEEFDALSYWKKMKLEFEPLIHNVAHMLKADASLKLSANLAKMLDDTFEQRIRAFYDAAYSEGYEEGRRREEMRFVEMMAALMEG